MTRRLEEAHRSTELEIPLGAAAWEMMKSQDFQNTKCEHGGLDDTPIFSVPIPNVDPQYIDENVGIGSGEMKFTRSV